MRKRKSVFREGEAIRLDNGAVVIPILNFRGVDSERLIEHLFESKNHFCSDIKKCNTAMQDHPGIAGISCKQCPLNGKSRPIIETR